MSSELSLSQRIHNANGSQEIEEVKALHCYLHARGQSAEEWSTVWSTCDDVSWAHFFGRMRGWKEVWHGSVTAYDLQAYAGNYPALCQKFPEVGGKDPRAFLSVVLHTLASGIVEVAEDGKSARSVFYTPGVMSATFQPDGKKFCSFLWERYGSDFVFEDGRWLYLHEQVCPDIDGDCDVGNWAHDAYELEVNPQAPRRFTGGGEDKGDGNTGGPPCTDPGPLHLGYSPVRQVQNTVPWPVPYKTLDNNNSFTPLSEEFIKRQEETDGAS